MPFLHCLKLPFSDVATDSGAVLASDFVRLESDVNELES